MAEDKSSGYEGWAILELMGHRRLAGKVSEEVIAGRSLLRLDVPAWDQRAAITQYYSPDALYCLTPTTEEVARSLAANIDASPISVYDIPELRQSRLEFSSSVRDKYDEDKDNEAYG